MLEKDPAVYGCLFCITGREEIVAHRIERLCPDVRAIAARKEKHKSVQGRKTRVEEILFPGYVFFMAPPEIEPFHAFPKDDIIRILTSDRGEWQLTDRDREFARWMFEHRGLLAFSKAYNEGEHIRMLSGPLKDMEGQIVRVDKRGRSGQVSLSVHGRSILVWLGFEMVDAVTSDRQFGDQQEGMK